jgi:hypothetical protein
MRRSAATFYLVAALSVTVFAETPPPVRPVKTSDQFSQLLVTGGDFAQRVALLRAASDLREIVLEALGAPQKRYPVARPILLVMNASLPTDRRPILRVTEDPGGVKLQLTFPTPSALNASELERALITALLTELAIRPSNGTQDPSADIPVPSVPRWIVDALFHKAHHPNTLLTPIAVRTLLNSGRIPSPITLLGRPEEDPVPSTEEEIDLHRCLFSLLRNRPDGKEGILKLLRRDSSAEPLRTLSDCFPSLGTTETALQREWTLHLASCSAQTELVSLDGPQTEIEIQKLLQIDLTDTESGRHFTFNLSQYDDYLRIPGAKALLQTRQLEWVALRNRAHFLYVEIINAYIGACAILESGQPKQMKELARRFRNATLERESTAAKLSRIHDQLNWFEAVGAPRQWTPKLAEFYRLLDELPPVSPKTKAALDRAEKMYAKRP